VIQSTPLTLLTFAGNVSSEWLTRGVWLSEAPVALADGSSVLILDLLKSASERFTELQDGLTPEAFATLSDRPERARDAELNGEALMAWRKYRGALSALRLALLGRLMFGTLVAFGDPGRPGADPEWIPVRSWYYLKPDLITRNKVSGDAGAYWFVKVVDLAQEASWRQPELGNAPLGETDAPAIAVTGVGGRPSSKHLYLAELQRRADNDELAPSLASQARDLATWLATSHPNHPPAGAKALENAIREKYHALKIAP
jgi:hypothetical protein